MARKPVLGRGISALIPDAPEDPVDAPGSRIIQLKLDEIEPNPFQPRSTFAAEQLEELMRSIQEKGVIQPIAVNRVGQSYQLIAGERRLRASKMAGVETIPAIIYEIDSQQELMELSLIENIQRENLNPIEEAEGYRALIDTCFLTQDAVAQKVGKDRSTVANMVRLLRLPEPVQAYLRDGQLQMGHARALLSLDEDDQRLDLARRAVEDSMTVREVEKEISSRRPNRSKRRPAAPERQQRPRRDPNLVDFEERLQRHFGTAVSIRSDQSDKGRIEVEFYNASDLERILDLLLDSAE